jgi:hypothetical protein
VKLAGLAATGAVGAFLLRGPGGSRLDYAVNAGLIAGGANLVNLFDLRPGRALKVAAAASTLLAAAPGRPATEDAASSWPPGAPLAAVPLGGALGLLGEDLAERAMLGDAGANALGAVLGTAAAASLPRPARIVLLAGIAGLTAASEVVSFTKVIERTPPLRWLDMLGRRPPAPPAGPPPAGPDPALPGPGTRTSAAPP